MKKMFTFLLVSGLALGAAVSGVSRVSAAAGVQVVANPSVHAASVSTACVPAPLEASSIAASEHPIRLPKVSGVCGPGDPSSR